MIETLSACITNPTVVCERPVSAIPPPLAWLGKHRPLIELERMARLWKTLRRDDVSLDAIRTCAKILTNYEIVGILSLSPARSAARRSVRRIPTRVRALRSARNLSLDSR